MKTLEELANRKEATPITVEDEVLFRELSGKQNSEDNCDFKDSWAYILQASRYFPYKIARKNELIILGAKKDESAIVIPNYFCSDERITEISKEIFHTIKLSIILKNANINSEVVLQQEFRKYEENESWDEISKQDDQTFPQRIINLQQLIKLKGKNYEKLRRDLNRFNETIPLEIRNYDKDDRTEAEKLCRETENQIPGYSEAHENFLKEKIGNYIRRYSIFSNNELVGITIFDRISKICAAFNAIIYDRKIPFLSSALMVLTAKKMAEEEYSLLNLQGSETAGLDAWKRKFNPVKSIEKVHLIYLPETNGVITSP